MGTDSTPVAKHSIKP